MKKVSGIYLITVRRQDQRPLIYVGQSVDCVRRRRHHMKTLRAGVHDNPRMQHVHNKYGGDAFSFEIAEECGREKLDEFEQWWLDFIRGSDVVMNIAMNATSPNRGRTFPADVRRKVSIASASHRPSPESRRLISLAMMGRKLSDESRAKMSATKLANGHTYKKQFGTDHHASRPVIGTPLSGGERIQLDAIRHGKDAGFDPSAIRRVCLGRDVQHKGYAWSFAVDHRLLDGYDGAKNPPPPDFIARLLAGAPDEIKARAEAFAGERASGGKPGEKKPGQ